MSTSRKIAAPMSAADRQLVALRHAALRGERFPCRCEYDGPQWHGGDGAQSARCAHCGGLRHYGAAMPPAAQRLTAEQRRADHRDWLALRRSERPAGIRAERPDRTAAQTAALSAAKRARLAELDVTRKRDEWTRRMANVTLDGAEILRRCALAVTAVGWATDDERDDCLSELVLSVGRKHPSWSAPATALSQTMLERRAHGRIVDARQTAERRRTVSLSALADERADDGPQRRASAWMAALSDQTARTLRRSALAGETAAGELWLRLSVVAGEQLHSDERAVLAAAMMDARSGPALAERLGMTRGALRVKLTEGRKRLAARYPNPDALADALADAAAYGAADDERVTIGAAGRAAEWLTTAAGHRTADLAQRASRSGRTERRGPLTGYGPMMGALPVTLRPTLTHSPLVAWLALSGRCGAGWRAAQTASGRRYLSPPLWLAARPMTTDERSELARRRAGWAQRRTWRLRIRAAVLAADLTDSGATSV